MSHANPWGLYNELIDGIPENLEVTDFCIGTHWAYIEASCGMGISHVVSGGAPGTFKEDPRDKSLKELVGLVKSWNFIEATLGIAAINAWYAQPDLVRALGGVIDTDMAKTGDAQNPLKSMRPDYAGANVAVVGHFPNVAAMSKTARVTVLERACTSPLDVPDPACEYILPSQDFVFMTGTTLTNKTAPRLLELSRETYCTVVGPSAVPAETLFKHGANSIAGSIVVDPEPAKLSIRGGTKAQWRAGIKKFDIVR